MRGNSDYDAAMAVEPGIRFPDDENGQDGPARGPAQDAAADPAHADADVDDARAKLTLALSAGDKFELKKAAARRGITVAKLVHEWIGTLDDPAGSGPRPVEPVAEDAVDGSGEPGMPADVRGRPMTTVRNAERSLDEVRAMFHGAFVAAARHLTVSDLARLGLRPDTAGMSPDEIGAFERKTMFDIISELVNDSRP